MQTFNKLKRSSFATSIEPHQPAETESDHYLQQVQNHASMLKPKEITFATSIEPGGRLKMIII
jgi:hypothetical protein